VGKRFWLAGGGLIVLLLIVFHSPILAAAGSALVLDEPAQKADIVLVLGGDGYGFRIHKAATLVQQGFAPHAMISGPGGFYGLHECELAIPFAVKAGFPESYFIHAENEALSTTEEAQVIVPRIRNLGARSVLLVTSDFHTRRAARVFRKAAPDLKFTVVAAPGHEFTPQGWWRSRQGQKIALLEWTKTVASYLGL
jgi:uncharacterized SAM-binding protein YcdF (DUF218 family)